MQKQGRIQQWWARRKLEQAIHITSRFGTQSSRSNVAKLLRNTPLLIAVEHLPDLAANAEQKLLCDTNLRCLTTTVPDGDGRALLVFSSIRKLRDRNRAVPSIILPLESVLSLMAESGFKGILINPSGPWVYLAAAELVD